MTNNTEPTSLVERAEILKQTRRNEARDELRELAARSYSATDLPSDDVARLVELCNIAEVRLDQFEELQRLHRTRDRHAERGADLEHHKAEAAKFRDEWLVESERLKAQQQLVNSAYGREQDARGRADHCQRERDKARGAESAIQNWPGER